MNNKLKPSVFIGGRNSFQKGIFQQNMILKLLPYTTDLDDIKKAVDLKSKAEVLRMMDKISIRKEFHMALLKHGLSIDNIVGHYQDIISSTDDDKVKLSALQILLKSLGLDKYEVADGGSGNWEEIMIRMIKEGEERNKNSNKINTEIVDADYEVNIPNIPDDERERREENLKIEKGIYE